MRRLGHGGAPGHRCPFQCTPGVWRGLAARPSAAWCLRTAITLLAVASVTAVALEAGKGAGVGREASTVHAGRVAARSKRQAGAGLGQVGGTSRINSSSSSNTAITSNSSSVVPADTPSTHAGTDGDGRRRCTGANCTTEAVVMATTTSTVPVPGPALGLVLCPGGKLAPARGDHAPITGQEQAGNLTGSHNGTVVVGNSGRTNCTRVFHTRPAGPGNQTVRPTKEGSVQGEKISSLMKLLVVLVRARTQLRLH